jgi:hypothetical protein
MTWIVVYKPSNTGTAQRITLTVAHVLAQIFRSSHQLNGAVMLIPNSHRSFLSY